MDLKDFVRKTLVDIADGIEAAQNNERSGGQIGSSNTGGHNFPDGKAVSNRAGILSTVIEFDVAVTTSNLIEGKASGKGSILVAQAGGEVSAERSSSKISRIKFSVPFVFKPNDKPWHNPQS